MVTYLYFVMVLLLAMSCGHREAPEPDVYGRLRSTYDHFLAVMGNAGVTVKTNQLSSIEIINPSDWPQPGSVGLCYKPQDVVLKNTGFKMGEKQGKIQILDTERSDEMSVTLVHEFGHCLLDMGHSEDPGNIMYPSADFGIFLGEDEAFSGILRNLGR